MVIQKELELFLCHLNSVVSLLSILVSISDFLKFISSRRFKSVQIFSSRRPVASVCWLSGGLRCWSWLFLWAVLLFSGSLVFLSIFVLLFISLRVFGR